MCLIGSLQCGEFFSKFSCYTVSLSYREFGNNCERANCRRIFVVLLSLFKYKFVHWSVEVTKSPITQAEGKAMPFIATVSGSLHRFPVEITSYFLLLAIGSPLHRFDLEDTTHSLSPVFLDDPHDALRLGGSSVWGRRDQIRRVCRQWNDIVEGNPVFWRCIAWGGHAPIEYLRIWLVRSRPLMVDLSLQFPWRLCHYNNLDTGMPPSEPSLFIRFSQQILDVIFPIRGSLRTLDISAGCSLEISVLTSTMVPLLFGDHLQSVTFHQIFPCKADLGPVRVPRTSEARGSGLSPVQHLVVAGLPLISPTVFPAMPALTVIDIRFSERLQSFFDTWAYLGEVLRHALALQVIRIVMPTAPSFFGSFNTLPVSRASSLSIALGGARNSSAFLQQFRLPGLESLSLTFDCTDYDVDYSGVYQSLLSTGFSNNPTTSLSPSLFQNIKHLCITCGVANRAVISSVLSSLEELEVLVFHGVGNSWGGTTAFLAKLLDRSLRREMGLKRRHLTFSLLCPKLRHFESWKTNGLIEPKFVHCRRRLGCPVTYVIDTLNRDL